MGGLRTFTGPYPGQVGVIARRPPGANEMPYWMAMQEAQRVSAIWRIFRDISIAQSSDIQTRATMKANADKRMAADRAWRDRLAFESKSRTYALRRQAADDAIAALESQAEAKRSEENQSDVERLQVCANQQRDSAECRAFQVSTTANDIVSSSEAEFQRLRQKVDEIKLEKSKRKKTLIAGKERIRLYSSNNVVQTMERNYNSKTCERDRDMQLTEARCVAEREKRDAEYWHRNMLEQDARKRERDERDRAALREQQLIVERNYRAARSEAESERKRRAADAAVEMDRRQRAELQIAWDELVELRAADAKKAETRRLLDEASQSRSAELARQKQEAIDYDRFIQNQNDLFGRVQDKSDADERVRNLATICSNCVNKFGVSVRFSSLDFRLPTGANCAATASTVARSRETMQLARQKQIERRMTCTS